MDEKKHSKQFEVHYYEVDKYRKATPVSILNFLEETALSHTEAIGYGIDRLRKEGLVWILTRWSLRIDRHPSWNEKLTVKTWPSSFRHFYATREFFIKDPDGNTVIRATSLWVLLNVQTRRPVRIPPELAAAYGISPERAVEDSFETLSSIEDDGHKLCNELNIRRSDIDIFNHVNNTKYLEWIMEAIPQEIYEGFNLTSFEITYKKETGINSHIAIISQIISKDEKCCELIHSIVNTDSDNESASSRTVWTIR